MQSFNTLLSVRDGSWSFPVTAAPPLPSASVDLATSLPGDVATATVPDIQTASDFEDEHSSTTIEQPILSKPIPPSTPVKSTKKSRKRKVTDPDGEYKSSGNKKKRAAPTPTKSKPKRKTYDYLAETDYKPTSKVVVEYTIDDEIDDDPDICHDDCEEKDEQDMIHCDGEACRLGGKWFHTGCVGFDGPLPSNIEDFEWYCLTCREELGVGEDTDGLIYRADSGIGDDGDVKVVARRLRSASGL
ncbi:uncharacterized protein RCC_00887 [Ramularia collo-cygni]|uniref:PHD-type domain-containing protein n=1 Tax=Ramularia collo-cygni TaxID=112498 RepID=A0A2D3V3V3_9PEZI|nr:uncharacterized protein RCC_00887 [Ramularia collo-cygni]CZT14963.1 uncharacterized protein RCC_00887 [Ramularia collo-cygni]